MQFKRNLEKIIVIVWTRLFNIIIIVFYIRELLAFVNIYICMSVANVFSCYILCIYLKVYYACIDSSLVAPAKTRTALGRPQFDILDALDQAADALPLGGLQLLVAFDYRDNGSLLVRVQRPARLYRAPAGMESVQHRVGICEYIRSNWLMGY